MKLKITPGRKQFGIDLHKKEAMFIKMLTFGAKSLL